MDISMNIKYVKSNNQGKNQGRNHIMYKRIIFTKNMPKLGWISQNIPIID